LAIDDLRSIGASMIDDVAIRIIADRTACDNALAVISQRWFTAR
jgi:hypothetical protein